MFPREVHWQDCIKLVRAHWIEGCTNIQPLQTKGACNYVAKHQVKECIGSEFQQKCSPVFARYSIYGGGIGRSMKNDKVMKERYLKSLKTRDKSDLCYYAYQGGKKYAISIPRFLIKEWHPDRFSTDELIMSQKEGFENLAQFIFDNLTDNCYLSPEFKDAFEFIDWQLENFTSDYRFTDCNDVDYQNYEQLEAISTVLKVVSKPLIAEDKRRKDVYINKHISAKLAKLKENIYTDYSPF